MLPRTPEHVTGTILVVNLVLLALYDLIVRVWCGSDATISVVLGDFCRREPIVACGIGVLVGHVMWSIR